MCTGQFDSSPRGPVMKKTVFGWIVAGVITDEVPRDIVCNLSHTSIGSNIEQQVVCFWEVETVPTAEPRTEEEISCEEHFVENTRRDEQGNFVVKLLLKASLNELGNSYDVARKQFLALEVKSKQ